MAGSRIARGCVAAECGVPCLVVRAVADATDMMLPRFISADGRYSLPGALLNCIAHPFDVPALLRLGRAYRRARTALAAVAREIIVDGLDGDWG